MSTEENKDELRRLMGEVAVLPPDDPQRQAVEAEIAQGRGWAEKEWLDLLQADEQLRLALRCVSMPHALEKSLLTIPDQVPRRRFVALRRRLIVGAAAAALVLTVGFFGYFQTLQSSREQTLADLAIHNHLKDLDDPHLAVESADRSVAAASLRSLVSFNVRIPDLGPEFRLVGGKRCGFGAHAIIYTRWERGADVYSLHQFRPRDFDLPETISRRVVVSKSGPAAGRTCEALLWARDGYGYALVGEHGAYLPENVD